MRLIAHIGRRELEYFGACDEGLKDFLAVMPNGFDIYTPEDIYAAMIFYPRDHKRDFLYVTRLIYSDLHRRLSNTQASKLFDERQWFEDQTSLINLKFYDHTWLVAVSMLIFAALIRMRELFGDRFDDIFFAEEDEEEEFYDE